MGLVDLVERKRDKKKFAAKKNIGNYKKALLDELRML